MLEATCDGKDLKEHLGRFLDPAKYKPMFDNGLVKQHAVLDFRSPGARQAQPRKTDEHLWSVVFVDGFGEAWVHHMGGCFHVWVKGNADEATRQALSATLPHPTV